MTTEDNIAKKLEELVAEDASLSEFDRAMSTVDIKDRCKVNAASALILAAEKNREDVIKLLKQEFFNVDSVDKVSGLSALAASILTRNRSMVKFLVEMMVPNY